MVHARIILGTLAAGLTLAWPACFMSVAHASAPVAACFVDWSDAVPVIQREALTTVRDIHSQARLRQIGEIVRVTLCTEEGRFVYRLLVREPKGRMVPLTVDARRPFEP